MSTNTGIEWTDATWNPIRGCSRVSEGCRHCYAELVAARFSGPGQPYEGLARRRANGEPQWTGKIRFVGEHLEDPLRWKRPRRIFVNSMSDLFHEGVSLEQLDKIFAVMMLAGQHRFQVLTKRPERMRAYLEGALPGQDPAVGDSIWFAARHLLSANPTLSTRYYDTTLYHHSERPEWPISNIWLGVSCEHQEAADERIPLLLETPAAVRFLSCEPLLGAIDLRHHLWYGFHRRPLHWVIAGGESGPHARPMNQEWPRRIRDQCCSAGVAFFFKQWGEHDPSGVRVGKKKAGRELDGRTWGEFPDRPIVRALA